MLKEVINSILCIWEDGWAGWSKSGKVGQTRTDGSGKVSSILIASLSILVSHIWALFRAFNNRKVWQDLLQISHFGYNEILKKRGTSAAK